MLQQWTLQFSARQADKVEPSRILDYVALCLSSIVVNKHLYVIIKYYCVLLILYLRYNIIVSSIKINMHMWLK